MASDTYHEPLELLPEAVRNLHRGLASLIEELEAIDWYQQRAAACSDEELKRVLLHNRDEEIEHAAMVLEWIRRNSPEFDRELRAYLFTDGRIARLPIQGKHGSGKSENPEVQRSPGSLGIGSLKAEE